MSMTSPTTDDAVRAFAQIIRERLKAGDPVRVPGFGTFVVEHEPSEMKKDDEGNVVMVPPQDVVRFTPET